MPLLSHRCSGQSNGRKEIAERWICALLFLQFLLLFVKINKNQRAERGRKHLNWSACPAATRCHHAVTLPANTRSDLNNWWEESGNRGPIPRTHKLQEKAGFQNKAYNAQVWSLRQQDPAIPMSLGKNLHQHHPKKIIPTTVSVFCLRLALRGHILHIREAKYWLKIKQPPHEWPQPAGLIEAAAPRASSTRTWSEQQGARCLPDGASHTAAPKKAPPPCEHPLHNVHQEGTTTEKYRKMSK